MPEENSTIPLSVKNMARRKSARRKRAGRAVFEFDEKQNIKITTPKANINLAKSASAAKKLESKSIYGRLAASFIALTLILVAVILYFGFSKLSIVIIPAREKVSDYADFLIVNQANNLSPASGQIAGVVRQVPMEQTKTFSSSGKEILGEEVVGKVIIINSYVKNQPLVASTRLLSADNKLFRLKNTVNVPPGGRVEAEVYADQAKPEMAIGPGKFTIPGLWSGLQDKIYAQSESAMKYSEKIKYTIQQSDVDKAVSELRDSLLAGVKSQLSQAYADYQQVIYEVDNNSLSQEVSGKVGEEKQQFSIKMKTMVTVVAFNDDDIFEQAEARLTTRLADDKQIAEFGKADLAYSLSDFNLKQGLATVKADFSAKVILRDSAKVIKKERLAGLDYQQLKNYLNGLPEVAGYEIKFFPSFVKQAPKLVDRIEIVIKK